MLWQWLGFGPWAACHPPTRSPGIPHDKQSTDTQTGTRCKPPAAETHSRTTNCTHQMQTSTKCLVFGIFSQTLLFSFVDVSISVSRHQCHSSKCRVSLFPAACRWPRPEGEVRGRQMFRQLSNFLCVKAVTLSAWTQRSQTDEVIDWPWLCVSEQWEMRRPKLQKLEFYFCFSYKIWRISKDMCF